MDKRKKVVTFSSRNGSVTTKGGEAKAAISELDQTAKHDGDSSKHGFRIKSKVVSTILQNIELVELKLFAKCKTTHA